MARPKRNFNPEFRQEAAELVLDQDYTIKEAAKAMNEGQSTMDNWVRRLKKESKGKQTNSAPISAEQRRIKELEQQVKRIERENEILKKATALLMLDSLKDI